jgi:hypothetical protein
MTSKEQYPIEKQYYTLEGKHYIPNTLLKKPLDDVINALVHVVKDINPILVIKINAEISHMYDEETQITENYNLIVIWIISVLEMVFYPFPEHMVILDVLEIIMFPDNSKKSLINPSQKLKRDANIAILYFQCVNKLWNNKKDAMYGNIILRYYAEQLYSFENVAHIIARIPDAEQLDVINAYAEAHGARILVEPAYLSARDTIMQATIKGHVFSVKKAAKIVTSANLNKYSFLETFVNACAKYIGSEKYYEYIRNETTRDNLLRKIITI